MLLVKRATVERPEETTPKRDETPAAALEKEEIYPAVPRPITVLWRFVE